MVSYAFLTAPKCRLLCRGEPLVLQKKLTLSGIAFENAARRLIGKQDYFIDLNNPNKGILQKITEMLKL